MIIVIGAFYAVLVWMEINYCKVQKEKKNFLIYIIFMGSQFIISILIFLEIELITPVDWIENLVRTFVK